METSNDYFEIALNFFDQDNYAKAIDNFTLCLQLDPKNLRALANRGLMYYYNENYKEAISDFNTALDLNPTLLDTYFNRALTNKEMANYEEALKDLSFLKESAYPRKTEVDDEIELVKEMIEGKKMPISFLKSITFNNKNEADFLKEGRNFENEKKYLEAIKCYTQAIGLNDDFDDAFYARARCYFLLGDLNKAVEDYQQIEDVPKYGEDIKINIGNAFAEMKEFDKAIAYFDQAQEMNPSNSENFFFRAQAKTAKEDLKGAFVDFTNSIELSPQAVEPIYQRGVLRMRMADYTGAINDFTKMESLTVGDGRPSFHKGVSYYYLNQIDKGVEQLKISSLLGFKKADEVLKKICG